MEAERDALAAQVEKLYNELLLTRQAAHRGMDAVKKGSTIQLQLAEKARAESSPDALASEREANAILTAENERLAAQVEALKENAERYQWVRRTFIADDEIWPDDVAEANTGEQLDVAIDAAREQKQ
ncbi:hypothetical protein ACQUFY_21735 [Robbsia andropogonis]|uniref:hypothetical protein n=1 Tax=Robbsia andropogonis TaxID=28092 RepID=UPI003D23B33E